MELGLGTVQFGLNYGISNNEGKTPPDEANAVIKSGYEEHIRYLDTASGYGESEKVVGNAIKEIDGINVITKTPAFNNREIEEADGTHLKSTFAVSCQNLQRKTIYGLLIHSAGNLLSPGGDRLFRAMAELKADGLIKKIGVSVYPEDSVFDIVDRYDLDLIQLPLNVLDQRLLISGFLHECKKRKIEIHVRSLFLQGLLLMPVGAVPRYFDPVRKILTDFQVFCKENGLTPLEAAYSFAKSTGLIDVVIVGVNNSLQLHANISAWKKSKQNVANFQQFSITETAYLNPSKWRLQ